MRATSSIMEGALARRLRTTGAFRTAARVELDPERGVVVLLGDVPLGAWRWAESQFRFTEPGHDKAKFVAHTIVGAAAFTRTLL